MAKKEKTKPSTNKATAQKQQPAKVASIKVEKGKKPKDISCHQVEIKCTNGLSVYTYSTIGKPNELVVIPAYMCPFSHTAFNKDKKVTIKQDSAFAKRYGFNISLRPSKTDDLPKENNTNTDKQ
jgi:hypothetical protein